MMLVEPATDKEDKDLCAARELVATEPEAMAPRSQEASRLIPSWRWVNPFTYTVEPLRFSPYLRLKVEALTFTAAVGFVFPTLAIVGDSSAKGLMPRKTGGAGGE